jgi:hypothetical protein
MVAFLLGILLSMNLARGSSLWTHMVWRYTHPDVYDCASGPWGNVWYVPSLIEIPPDRIQIPGWSYTPVRWYMEAESSDRLATMLRSCGLTSGQVGQLLDSRVGLTNGVGYVLQPSESFILDLSPEVRSRLYDRLGRYPQNDSHFSPFRFGGDESQEWLTGESLLPEVKELTESLIYHHGKTRMFSDMNLVLNRYPSPQVYSNLFFELSRESTLIARVRVMPGDDVDRLAQYWGTPDRQAEVRTLLKTVQLSGSLQDVSVTLLLPSFARDRVYRYSRPDDPPFPSCHYTSMNFFNDEPDDRLTNLVEAAKVLASDYVVVTNDFRLGDVILFMKNGREAIHSCNYIADRIVFTRNGGGWAQPWMLTTLDALMDFYSYPDPVSLKVVRRRAQPHGR